MKDGFLKQGWLVIVLALAFGAALAGVEATLSGRIAQNKLDETLSRISSLVPGAVAGEQATVAGRRVFRAVDKEGTLVGWVLPAGGAGFADKIELLIGLDRPAATITGLSVLTQKETPELGSKIQDVRWCDQFRKESAAMPVKVVTAAEYEYKTNGEVVAVSGATISSSSVADIVNEAIAAMADKLLAAGKAVPTTAPAED